MDKAILEVLGWINSMVLSLSTDGSKLTGTMYNFMPELYGYTEIIMTNVVLPVAYTILALFLVLELYSASLRTENMGSGMVGTEMIFKTMVKMVLAKIAVDSVPLILNAIYEVTTHITKGIAEVIGNNELTGAGLDLVALTPIVEDLSFWSGLIALMFCFLVFLVTTVAVVFANIVILTRFIQLFIHFAIAPIPIATFPNAEMSQIGKNFLKSFTATSIQGTLIFLVLSFFPILFNNAFFVSDTGLELFGSLMGMLGYSILLILSVSSTGRWSRTITSAV